jgi:protein-disulfide isomerase
MSRLPLRPLSLPRAVRGALLTFALAGCAKADDEAAPAAAAPAAEAPTAPAPFDIARVDKSRQLGSASAKVWFIVGSDFECPFCRAFETEAWPSIQREYVATGKIRVAFMNFPMYMKAPPMHPRSVPAAEVAMCAGAQEKFWQMHDSLFVNQDKWARAAEPMPIWESFAKSLGLDVSAWRNCLTSHATRAMVEQDFARLLPIGVQGTPSFVIGDSLAIVGTAPYAEYKKAIDAALARAR